MPHPAARSRRLELAAAWLLPLVLWALSTMYLGGALGKNTDDYAIDLRDPVTLAAPTPFDPFVHYPYFWRPLHVAMCFAVGTLAPGADRPVHLFVALMHGATALALWAVLRAVSRSRLAPAAAALVFLTLPLHGEVAFWFCTTSTAIGTALMLAACLLAVRAARRPTLAGPFSPAGAPGVFALTLLTACFYEQSAAIAAALPFLALAATPPSLRWPARLRRALAPTAAAGAACALYVVLLAATAPKSVRGGAGSFVTADRLGARLAELASGVRATLVGDRAAHVLMGSVEHGLSVLASPAGVAWGGVFVAAGVLWLVWAARRGGPAPGSAHAPSPRAGWAVLAGIAVFFAGWLPVFVIDRQIVELRNAYVPLVGLALAVGVGLDALLAAAPRAPAPRLAAGIVALAAAALGAAGLVGWQSLFQRRSELDLGALAQLRSLVPDPPPGAVFMPLRTNDAPAATGRVLFDRARYGVFETVWSATPMVQRLYRRADLRATAFNPWAPLALDTPDAAGVRWAQSLKGNEVVRADPAGGTRIPWEAAVPFVIDASGRVKLVRRIDVELPDHRDLQIHPPVVEAAIARAPRGAVPTATHRLPGPEPGPELIETGDWAFGTLATGGGADARFTSVWCWGVPHPAVWLAPAGPQESMRTRLPPLARPERVLLRTTIAEYDLDRRPDGPAVEVRVAMGAAPDRLLGSVRLEPAKVRQARRWIPLIVEMPPRTLESGDDLIISAVRVDAAGNPDPGPAVHPVWVTRPLLQSIRMDE